MQTESLGTFLHISIQNFVKQLLLDSVWQVLYVCKDMCEILYYVCILIKS